MIMLLLFNEKWGEKRVCSEKYKKSECFRDVQLFCSVTVKGTHVCPCQ